MSGKEEKKEQKTPRAPKGRKGGAGFFTKAFLFLGVVGLAVAVGFIAVPRDMGDVDGAGESAASAPRKDVRAMLKAALERRHEVSFTEEELNGYLYRTLAMEQKGLLGPGAVLEEVRVNLEAGHAEIILVRSVYGHRLTTSVFLQIDQAEESNGTIRTEVALHGGPYFPNGYPNRGGRFGRLVVPQGFFLLVKPEFEKLAGVYQEEIEAISGMARIRIEEGRMVFNPQPPDDGLSFPEAGGIY